MHRLHTRHPTSFARLIAVHSRCKSSLSIDPDPAEKAPTAPRKITVMTNVQKAVYVHYRNKHALWWWYMSVARWYFFVGMYLYGLAHVFYRYRMGKKKSAETVMIGENLLDETTKVYLAEIEKLRERDPTRLENEANAFHETFWKSRAHAMSDDIKKRRDREEREEKALASSGTDMSEWVEAKTKDKKEKEIARRTREYILGFHRQLKLKKLL